MAKRPKFDPRDHGLDMTLPQFRDFVAKSFDSTLGGVGWTIDEVLLNPDIATGFCDRVRKETMTRSLSDSNILRALLNHRKAKRKPRRSPDAT